MAIDRHAMCGVTGPGRMIRIQVAARLGFSRSAPRAGPVGLLVPCPLALAPSSRRDRASRRMLDSRGMSTGARPFRLGLRGAR